MHLLFYHGEHFCIKNGEVGGSLRKYLILPAESKINWSLLNSPWPAQNVINVKFLLVSWHHNTWKKNPQSIQFEVFLYSIVSLQLNMGREICVFHANENLSRWTSGHILRIMGWKPPSGKHYPCLQRDCGSSQPKI